MMKGRSRAETTTTIFTVNQWNELESQVLTFRYLMSGLPVPPSLMSSVFSSSSSSSDMFPQHQHPPPPPFGSSYFHVGYGHGRKVDMEPGRCRRTDGKKWRCSKEAHPNSKYCERHMQRSKSKAKKAITNRNPEITTATSSAPLSNAYSPYPAVSYCPVTQSSYPNNKFQPGNSTFYPFLSTQSSSSNVSGSVRNGGTGPNWLGLDDVFLDQPRKEETRYTNSHTRGIVGESFSGFEASSKEEHKNETVGEVKEEEHESQKLYHHFLGDWPSKLNNSRALGLYSTSN